MALNLFNGGLPAARAALPWPRTCTGRICVEAADASSQQLDDVPEDLQALDELLSDTYFCNFSLFQSIPDSWAIKQLFPVMPIHRLDERPTQHAVLGDITCDSDGKIDQFIDRRDVKKTLPLHPFNGEPYYLGVFLVGAYQEILGDLHNLFGDTHAVHVSLERQDGRRARRGRSRATRCGKCSTTSSSTPSTCSASCGRTWKTAVRDGRIDYRGVRPPAALLRRRPARLHVPRGSEREIASAVKGKGLPKGKTTPPKSKSRTKHWTKARARARP